MEHWLYNHHLNVIAQMLRGLVRIIFSADVPPQMQIGKGTVFPHDALGCVFHPDVKIGKNCKILHGVTMGGRAGHKGLPIIGDNVVIGTHAQLIGNVKIPEFGISDCRFSCYARFPIGAYYICPPNNMDGKMQNCKVQMKFTLLKFRI